MLKSFSFLTLIFAACSTETVDVDVELDEEVAAIETTLTLTCDGVDTTADPSNCGACGNVCASGLCYAGVCADDRAGNIFVIGNSYRTSNPALDRILGNAVFLREGKTVNVLVYRGTAAADIATGTSAAISRAASMMRRSVIKTVAKTSPSIQILLPAADVLVIEAQPHLTDASLEALADEWSLPIDDLLRRGGIVVVLDAPATNAGTPRVLGSLMPMTRTTTTPGTVGYVATPDNIAVGRVPLTFALRDSVGYAPSGHVDAVTSESGDIMVAHRAVY